MNSPISRPHHELANSGPHKGFRSLEISQLEWPWIRDQNSTPHRQQTEMQTHSPAWSPSKFSPDRKSKDITCYDKRDVFRK